MRLEPLYTIRFAYPEHYLLDGAEIFGYLFAEGHCDGYLEGRFRGMNHPRVRRSDDVFLPDFQGVIETDDGARIGFDVRGYGRPRGGDREIVGTIAHTTGDERYARLNSAQCVLAGEAIDKEIRIEVAELVWEPLGSIEA
jgi:hypothetical protein